MTMSQRVSSDLSHDLPCEAVLVALKVAFGVSWGVLGASWSVCERLGSILGASWGVLGASWSALGPSGWPSRSSGTGFGVPSESGLWQKGQPSIVFVCF